MSKDTPLQQNPNVQDPQNLEEILKPLKLALKNSGSGIRELERLWSEAKVGWDSILSSIRHFDPGFQPDTDSSPELVKGNLPVEVTTAKPAIEKNERTQQGRRETRARLKNDLNVASAKTGKGKKPRKETFDDKVLKMLETEELTPREMCGRLTIDANDNRSRFTKLYVKADGQLGRRREPVALTKTYRYATRGYYEARGIKAAYPGEPDVMVE